MKNFYKLLFVVPACVIMLYNTAFGQQPSAKAVTNKDAKDTSAISTVLTAHSANAIFKTAANYTFSVDNNTGNPQTGKVSYIVTDQFNKKLLADSVKINLGANSTGNYDFTIPEDKPGFYKVNFMVNVTDYDDTTRRIFGIRPEEIKSSHPKPNDFDQFWEDTKSELAAVEPEYIVTERTDLEKDNRKVYLISMKSLGGFTISAWLTEPEHKNPHQTFPVLLMLPGYQATNKPLMGKEYDMAFLGLDVRGQGLSKPGLEMRREDYIVSLLESKDNYILRGIIMDCIRAVDFIFTRPELSHDRISVTGGSMGGYLSITTAALDSRVSICAPQNPFMSDIYNMDNGAVTWPINHMKEYVKIRPGLTFDKVLNNLQYFDTKNFATKITCPVVMGIGLLDPFVPPNNSYAVYNNITAKKKIFVFKDLGHEVGDKYYNYETLYTRDYFGLFF
jgi:cephalosporin-C deacetylase